MFTMKCNIAKLPKIVIGFFSKFSPFHHMKFLSLKIHGAIKSKILKLYLFDVIEKKVKNANNRYV